MIIFYLVLSTFLIIIDQYLKYYIANHFLFERSRILIPHFLSLTYLKNSGIAWSMLEGKVLFFTIFSCISIAIFLYILIRYRCASRWLLTGLSFMIGGALGNLIDRIRFFYVIDMFQLEFVNFPVFNIADICLFIGASMIIIYTLMEEKLKRKEK